MTQDPSPVPPVQPRGRSASLFLALACFVAGGIATALVLPAFQGKEATATVDQHAHGPIPVPTRTPAAVSTTAISTTAGSTEGKDAVSLAPVADVNGTPITLRDMEDALLKKEGVDEVERKLHSLLEITDWSRLKDDDLIVATKFGRVLRRDLAVDLLKEKGAEVREDLIELALLNQAMNTEGVVFDKQAIDAELARMEKRLQEELEKRHKPMADLRTAIMQKENLSLEDFVRTPVFKMLTGMHLLVQRRAEKEIGEDELKKYFYAHLSNYQVHEAVDLSDIFLPYPRQRANAPAFSQQDKDTRLESAVAVYNAIRKQDLSFEKIFRLYDAQHDENADGHIGWVPRSGQVGKRGNRTLPAKVMDMAFAAQQPFPNLLPPIEHDDGIDIVIVHGRRATQQPIFALLREKVLVDLVDSQIEPLTDKLRLALRRAAVINYDSLPPLIEARERPVADAPGSGAIPEAAKAAVREPTK